MIGAEMFQHVATHHSNLHISIVIHIFLAHSQIIEYFHMLLGRSKSRRPRCKLDDLVNHLRGQNHSQSFALLRSLANQPEIQEYFKDFHLIADSLNFCTFHKYQTLNDGLYILLKGEMGCLLNRKLSKGQNHKRSKSYGLKDSHSFIINEPLTVFEASFKNCTAYQDSYLLKVSSQQAESTFFEKGRLRRKQLYQSQYLSQDHHQIYSIPQCHLGVLRVGLNIHSIFHFAKYTFRQIIKLSSPAIVSEGRAKLKTMDFNVREFDQYGVLLPNLKYEVTSSTLSIMIIRNHESLKYNFDINLLKSAQSKEKIRHSKENVKSPSLGILKQENIQNERRNKEFAKISKQIENYSILPIFLCTRKFKHFGQTKQNPLQIFRKKVDFHQKINQSNSNGHQLNCIASQNSSPINKVKQSSLYNAISSHDSTKTTKFYEKLKVTPTEGQLLSKIRNKLREDGKYKSVFVCDSDNGIQDINYMGCLSEQ